jgi:hypothetical protein
MSVPHQSLSVAVHDACDRFFSIPELFRMFLNECSTQVLLNCMMVCTDWNQIICGTESLQEHLFLKPAEPTAGVCRKLNPILRSHFAPILCPDSQNRGTSAKDVLEEFETGPPCTYSDIRLLPWAQDPSVDAPRRRAFTRDDASWREMLVSQPPLERIDWWHEWLYDGTITDDNAFRAASRGFNSEEVGVDGWGHQDQSGQFVTLGMLWDLVEGRLARGCLVRVHYFLEGKAVEDDSLATEEERKYIAEGVRSQRPYTPSTARVKISTQQIWNKIPWRSVGFDMTVQRWIDMPQRGGYLTYGDGFNALRADCREDWGHDGYRFSQCEGFCYCELDGESSGMVGRDEP